MTWNPATYETPYWRWIHGDKTAPHYRGESVTGKIHLLDRLMYGERIYPLNLEDGDDILEYCCGAWSSSGRYVDLETPLTCKHCQRIYYRAVAFGREKNLD